MPVVSKQAATHERNLRLQKLDQDADNLAIKLKLGYAAAELAREGNSARPSNLCDPLDCLTSFPSNFSEHVRFRSEVRAPTTKALLEFQFECRISPKDQI